METVVGPVLVVAVSDVGGGVGEAEFRVEKIACQRQAEGAEHALLVVGAGLVGTGAPVVIEREGVVAVVQVDQAEIHVEARVVRKVDAQLAAPGEFVEVVRVVGIEMDVVDVAVACVRRQRGAEGDRVGKRAAVRCAETPHAEIAGFQSKAPGRLMFGRVAAQRNESRQCVGAVEVALGTAEHFDLLDIEQRRNAPDPAEVHAVDEQPHRRIQRLGELAALPDTPNLEESRPRSAVGQIQVRRRRNHLLEVRSVALTNERFIEHRHAGRHVLDFRFPQVPVDDDLVDLLGGRRVGQCQ